MLINVAIGLAGILITLLVFMITYRQTIGARKERVKSANKEIVTILVRSIANTKIEIDKEIIQSVIRSKAREYNVSIDDLNDIFMLLEDIIAKYMENEFISEEVKNFLIKKLRDLIEKEKKSKISVKTFSDLSKDKLTILISTSSATIATIGIVVIFRLSLKIPNLPEFSTAMLVAMFGSIAMATLMAFIKLALDRREKIRNEVIYKGPMLEEIVFSALEEHFSGSNIQQELIFMDGKKLDFVVRKKDESIPVEVKYLLDEKILPRVIRELQIFIKRLKAKKGLLIVNTLVVEKDKKIASENNIIIIENAFSKQDIIRQLKEID